MVDSRDVPRERWVLWTVTDDAVALVGAVGQVVREYLGLDGAPGVGWLELVGTRRMRSSGRLYWVVRYHLRQGDSVRSSDLVYVTPDL